MNRILGLGLVVVLAGSCGSDGSPGDDMHVEPLDPMDSGAVDPTGDSGAGDAGEIEDPEECPGGGTLCSGRCVDITSDPLHCGGCGAACAIGAVCESSTCRVVDCRMEPCTGLTYCDLATGQCLPGCLTDDQCGASEECSATHDCECVSGYDRCEGRCVSMSSASGHPCPSGSYCDFGTNMCESGCGYDSQCGENGRCVSHACECSAGAHVCGGRCLLESDPAGCGSSCTVCPTVTHGAATCTSGTCGLRCDSGYHLCGSTCVADADASACGDDCRVCPSPTTSRAVAACIDDQCTSVCESGTTMCHGRCQTGTCSWSAVTGSGAAFIGIEVSNDDVVHVVTTNNFDAVHYRIVSRSLVTSSPAPTIECFETDGFSVDTAAVVSSTTGGAAIIACVRGNMGSSQSWNGTGWSGHDLQNSVSLNSAPWDLGKIGRDVIGYHFCFPSGGRAEYRIIVKRFVSGAWTTEFTHTPRAGAEFLYLLRGTEGDVQVAWNHRDETTLYLMGEGDAAPTSVPHVAYRYALDGDGQLVGVSTALRYYTYAAGAWTNEAITTGTATDLDLVVDGGGNVHVAWVNDSGLYYAIRAGGVWTSERVNTERAWYPDLEVGRSGKAAIAVINAGETFRVFE